MDNIIFDEIKDLKEINFNEKIELVKHKVHKQLPIGVPKKTRSENMQQIYRKTQMSKSDFNKVALQLY